MAKCPNCSATIAWDASKCSKCPAEFGAGAAWHPRADTPVEAEQLERKYGPPGESSIPRVPSGIGLANLSLGLAFGLAALLSPGGRILRLVVDLPVVQSMPPYQAHLLNVAANYWIPAVIVYLVFRLTKAGSWLKPTTGIHATIGIANLLLTLYVAARVLASSVEGGGGSFVVMSFSAFVVLPSWSLLLTGFVWLVARSIRQRKENLKRWAFTVWEGTAVLAATAVPVIFVAMLFLGEEGAFRVARQAEKVFQEKCKMAGEKLIKSPPEEVQSLFFEKDYGVNLRVEGANYSSQGMGIILEPMVNSGWLLYGEKPNDRPRKGEDPQKKYRKYALRDSKGEPVDEITSKYGVFTTDMTNDAEKKIGIHGAETRIVDLASKETIAVSTYFVSNRHRGFCGHAPDGNFYTTDLIRRALNLKRQYPSAFPQDANKNR